jgi:hypothetical protein
MHGDISDVECRFDGHENGFCQVVIFADHQFMLIGISHHDISNAIAVKIAMNGFENISHVIFVVFLRKAYLALKLKKRKQRKNGQVEFCHVSSILYLSVVKIKNVRKMAIGRVQH